MPSVGAWHGGAGRSGGTYDIVNDLKSLRCYPTHKLACYWHSFVDADRRREEASGSDTNDHTTRSNSSSHNLSVLFTAHGASIPSKSGKRTLGQLHAWWVTLGTGFFIVGSRSPIHCTRRRHYLYIPKLFTLQVSMNREWEQGWSGSLPVRSMRN